MNSSSVSPDSKIKVVHLLHTMDYGGVETIILNFLDGIDNDRFDVHMVCFANPGGTEHLFIEAAERAGVSVRTIPWHRGKPIPRSARALVRILRETQADIIHTHNIYADVVGLVAAKWVGIKTIDSQYVWSDFGWKRNALQWINQIVLRYFDLVAAQCERTKRDTCMRGISEDRVKVLHTGFKLKVDFLDAEERQAQRSGLGIAESDVLLVNIARLYPEKAQDVLIREFQIIHQKHPNAKLWILGRGPLKESLQNLISELNLDESVTLRGYVSDPDIQAQLADIQVHPSYAEGIPMAILSGMALGLPIVSSDVGGIVEVLEPNTRGILVPAAEAPGFNPAFRDEVMKLIEQPAERTRLGNNARHYIESDYTLENAAQTLEQFYVDLVAS